MTVRVLLCLWLVLLSACAPPVVPDDAVATVSVTAIVVKRRRMSRLALLNARFSLLTPYFGRIRRFQLRHERLKTRLPGQYRFVDHKPSSESFLDRLSGIFARVGEGLRVMVCENGGQNSGHGWNDHVVMSTVLGELIERYRAATGVKPYSLWLSPYALTRLENELNASAEVTPCASGQCSYLGVTLFTTAQLPPMSVYAFTREDHEKNEPTLGVLY